MIRTKTLINSRGKRITCYLYEGQYYSASELSQMPGCTQSAEEITKLAKSERQWLTIADILATPGKKYVQRMTEDIEAQAFLDLMRLMPAIGDVRRHA